MPRRDQTGPMGAGPMTGRGFGPCSGKSESGFGVGRRRAAGYGFGRGRCYGRGFGRGFFGRGFYADMADQASPETHKELLQEQKAVLEEQLELLEKEIESL